VAFVSWLDAARYSNWQENGRPTGSQEPSTTETGAFDLTVVDPAYHAVLSETATVSLATEDEWYKAAYYDPTAGGSDYWLYPTRSDAVPAIAAASPDGRVANPGAEVANFELGPDWNGLDGNVTAAGTAEATSFYGGLDMAGNVEEWLANDVEPGPGGLQRVVRGGSFADTSEQLAATAGSTYRDDLLRDPLVERPETGFRMVRFLPEPGVAAALFPAIALLAALARRRTGAPPHRGARSVGSARVKRLLGSLVAVATLACTEDPDRASTDVSVAVASERPVAAQRSAVVARVDGIDVERGELIAFL
jgi:hypothetical protein